MLGRSEWRRHDFTKTLIVCMAKFVECIGLLIGFTGKFKARTQEFELIVRESVSADANHSGNTFGHAVCVLKWNAIDAAAACPDVTLFFVPMPEAVVDRSSSNKQMVEMLRRSRLFRDYEGVFSKATELALALRPVDYWQLEHQGKKNQNPFCALLPKHRKSLAVCLQAHQEMIDHPGELPPTVTCPFGLTETAVPVKLGANIVGYLRIGQVLRHMPARADT